jgi:hypothetical protein
MSSKVMGRLVAAVWAVQNGAKMNANARKRANMVLRIECLDIL